MALEFLNKLKSKLGIIDDFTRFLWKRKLWWLIPMVLILFFLGLILVMTQGSVIAPFIYTLF